MSGRRMRRATTKTNPLAVLAVILLAIASVLAGVLIMAGAGAQFFRREDPQPVAEHEPQEPEEDVVTVGGQQVEIDRSLPQSELDAAHFTTNADGSITYSGKASYGIDVSSHQGEIDWAAAAGDGVEFAMLRIGYRGYSEGALNPDSQFEANYAQARENGIAVGVYFFSQAVSEAEALEEAEQVLNWLDGRVLDCPVVFDWEHITYDTARTDEVPGETVTECARIFCETIAAEGYEPMVYCNGMLGYLSYDLNELSDVPIWYAEYSDYPSYAYEMEIWQYTDSGTVAGIQGAVDRNIWFQTEEG